MHKAWMLKHNPTKLTTESVGYVCMYPTLVKLEFGELIHQILGHIVEFGETFT